MRVQSLSPWIRRDVPECHFMDTSNYEYLFLIHSTCGASGKEPTSLCRRHKGLRFNPWVPKILWSRKWQPTLVSLPGASPWAEEPGGLQSGLGLTLDPPLLTCGASVSPSAQERGSGAGGVQTAKASRKQSSLLGKESAQGCLPKRLLGRPD